MKKHFGKKAAALALVLSLFVSLLSVAAAAEGTGSEGKDPVSDISLVSNVETTEENGMAEEEPASDVGLISDVETTEEPGAEEEPAPDVSLLSDDETAGETGAEAEELESSQETPAEDDFLVNEQPSEEISQPKPQAEPSSCTNGGEHTFGQKNAANYTPCSGGIKTEFYVCTVCSRPFNTDGSEAEWVDGTGEHTLSEKHEANYAPCGGGFQTDYYVCSVCRRAVDAEGNDATYVQGTGVHTPGAEKHEANYTPCRGGCNEDWYECTTCQRSVNAEGSPVTYVQGTGVHTPGAEKHAENYLPCCGGWTTEWYECADCGFPVKADGSAAEWAEGTGRHTPGDKINASYTECGGGYKADGYICTVCGGIVNADGNEMERIEGTGRHTPGDELFSAAATSTPCDGGYKTDYYLCTACHQAVDADGSVIYWIGGNGEHQTVYVPAAAPTYEEWGHQAYWECSVCHLRFADSAGKRGIHENIWVPPLTRDQEVKTEALTAVPETIAEQYPTVEAVQTALLNSAKSVGFQPDAANAGGVLLDVTLQIRNADGSLTPVSPEDFPAEGVTVVIPYPAGTDKNYTFFLTHMITHGLRAGQTEVLTSVNGEDGIYVYFTSMSPVYISYMLEADAPAPAAPAPAPASPVVSSTVPKTGDPAHGAPWGMLALLSIGGLGALSITGKKLGCF